MIKQKRRRLSIKEKYWTCIDNQSHNFLYLRTVVDFIRIFGELGITAINVEVYHEFYCSKCLTLRYKLLESENLLDSGNWHARFQYYVRKYGGDINDHIIKAS